MIVILDLSAQQIVTSGTAEWCQGVQETLPSGRDKLRLWLSCDRRRRVILILDDSDALFKRGLYS